MITRTQMLAQCGLAALALTVAACGGGSGYSNPTTPTTTTPPAPTTTGGAADVTIRIVGMNGNQSFSPNPANVRVGQTVAWVNADAVAHTATARNSAFDTGTVAAGATSGRVTMTAAGGYDYICTIHPSMVGTVNVTQ